MSIKNEMVEQLKTLKDVYGAKAIKISYETEDLGEFELYSIMNLVKASGIGLLTKLGGGEAFVNLKSAEKMMPDYILGPMIESKFVLGKYLALCEKVIGKDNAEFMINIETEDACKDIESIIDIPNIELLTGVVIGRTDLMRSFKANSVEDDVLLDACRSVFKKLKENNIKCMLGGGISPKTLPFMASLGDLVDGFETRKVVFPDGVTGDLEEAIKLALEFEINWYEYKKEYYGKRASEDQGKIDGLKALV